MKGVAAIIEARMGSSRLPGKILMKIKGSSILSLLIDRIKKVPEIDKIIVATTIDKKDDILEEYCKKNKIICFRGSQDDVMGRVLQAAKTNNVKIIVEITGDCPLIDPQIISQILNCYIHNDYDYVGNSNVRSYPDGMDVQIFSTAILEDSYTKTQDTLDREHVTLHIRKNDSYSKFDIIAPSNQFFPDLGLTLDEMKDYILIKKIFQSFENNDFNLNQILDLLNNENPELKKINVNVKRKGDT